MACPMASAASRTGLSARWAYRWVVAWSVCPNALPMVVSVNNAMMPRKRKIYAMTGAWLSVR